MKEIFILGCIGKVQGANLAWKLSKVRDWSPPIRSSSSANVAYQAIGAEQDHLKGLQERPGQKLHLSNLASRGGVRKYTSAVINNVVSSWYRLYVMLLPTGEMEFGQGFFVGRLSPGASVI